MRAADASCECVSRRTFHRAALGSAALGLLGSGRATAQDSATKNLPKGRYVDMHTHIGQVWNTTNVVTVETLLRWMDASDIAQAVVLPLVSPESASYPLTSETVLAETKPHRDRLIPFCSIDPRTSFTGAHKALVDMLKRYIDAGARGLGEHKPGIPVDDPRNLALYAACNELKLPLLFHMDNERNMDAPGLPGLARALQSAPDVKFIGHGPGWWASISGSVTAAELGGYPKGEVTPGGAIDALMDKYPNLYGELSAGSGAGAIARDPKFGRDFLIRRVDRVMFGTDFLSPGQNIPQLELFDKLNLPEEVQAKVFRENARKLLGMV
jgi:predicted TIM-barrel fold metal-dependent hydrolase